MGSVSINDKIIKYGSKKRNKMRKLKVFTDISQLATTTDIENIQTKPMNRPLSSIYYDTIRSLRIKTESVHQYPTYK